MSTAPDTRSDTPPPTPAEVPVDLDKAVASRRGTLAIADRVVEKIAAQAATEVDGITGVRRRMLGRTVGELTESSRPRASAQVDGDLVTVKLALSVEYPRSVRATAAAVRAQVARRVDELCGLRVEGVDVEVPSFLMHRAPAPRVV